MADKMAAGSVVKRVFLWAGLMGRRWAAAKAVQTAAWTVVRMELCLVERKERQRVVKLVKKMAALRAVHSELWWAD